MLQVRDLSVAYGDVVALHSVSLDVELGEIVAVLGPNGAGKTSLLRAISGLLPVRSGSIGFLDEDIAGTSPSEIVKAGLIQVPEGRQLFGELTVQENLELGSYVPAARRARKDRLPWVYDFFPILADRRAQAAGTLSGGEQQMLAIARALMSLPKLLILDEPSLGIAPIIVERVVEKIVTINREGVTIILAEQNAVEALDIANRAYVLEQGRDVLHGRAEDVMSDERVRRAYLGA